MKIAYWLMSMPFIISSYRSLHCKQIYFDAYFFREFFHRIEEKNRLSIVFFCEFLFLTEYILQKFMWIFLNELNYWINFFVLMLICTVPIQKSNGIDLMGCMKGSQSLVVFIRKRWDEKRVSEVGFLIPKVSLKRNEQIDNTKPSQRNEMKRGNLFIRLRFFFFSFHIETQKRFTSAINRIIWSERLLIEWNVFDWCW